MFRYFTTRAGVLGQAIRIAAVLVVLGVNGVIAAMSVSLLPTVPSPAPLGKEIVWVPVVQDASPGTLWYRYRARRAGEPFRVVRDYGPEDNLHWTAIEHEGNYEVEVIVRNRDSGEWAGAIGTMQLLPRVASNTPVINPTLHPMVFLYSAPPCQPGSQMRVWYQAPDGSTQSTHAKPCRQGLTMNFYVGGMRGGSDYVVKHTVERDGQVEEGRSLSISTVEPTIELPQRSVEALPSTNEIVLQSPLAATPFATDLEGNVVWYYNDWVTKLTRPSGEGRFVGLQEDYTRDTSRQVVREFDLAGFIVQETNAARVNEQLAVFGNRRLISGFHHEAFRMPDGKLLVLANNEQILTDVQGPGPVDVIGDMIIVLDEDLNVVWTWDVFDHIDHYYRAVLDENCVPGGGGCPAFYLARTAKDWTHGNSVQLTPDGHLVFSMRHLDWVVKINYANGSGSGDIIWRLGRNGDFQFESGDPFPSFSHQHDAGFLRGDPSTLVVFDNGNTRRAGDSAANSRGQVIRLDEANRKATLILNADLGQYSPALGSAQQLPNGTFHFNVGIVAGTSTSVEVDESGNLIYALKTSAPAYRTFRMQNMYTPF